MQVITLRCWTILMATLTFAVAPRAVAVDFESFLFNDGNGTELDQAANTANPGNIWATNPNVLTPAEVENGVFKITKDNLEPAPSVLNIANVTTGTRYIAVDLAGWAFRNPVADEPEDLRFAFINEDDGLITGNTITAQMQIGRNNDNQAIELTGDAVGVGSVDLPRFATLSTDQTAPFKIVLQLDKLSNTFEVFYKNGTSPSQSLGLGVVNVARNGNALRLFVNNDFGSTPQEFISIDRIAVTDANPLTDLVTLEINRNSGEMRLINSTGGSLANLESYRILSASGALNAANWKTIAANYDSDGDDSVDNDNTWSVDVSNVGELSESVDSGNGGMLTGGQQVVLSMGAGPWVRSPIEDLFIELQFAGGVTRAGNVNFVGNGGKRLAVGDLNFDGMLTVADWTTLIANAETDLSGLTGPALYSRGDLDLDGMNNVFDFAIFKNAFEDANGVGSFEAMLASVPEPATASVLLTGLLAIAGAVRRRRAEGRVGHRPPISKLTALSLASAVGFCIGGAARPAGAGILDDFTFSDANGTMLEDTANSANPAHSWNEDDDDHMSPSAVQNGAYRIIKANDDIGSNYLDNNNITTGKGWLVAEMSGWSFSSLVGPAEFDSAELEEVRFAFLNNEGNAQGGSTITGQAIIERNAAGGIQLVGKLTTGAPEIAPLPLMLTRTTPFTVVLEIDESTENFSVYYKDNAGPYVLLGTAPHTAGRNGNSVRFYANNNFGGTGEFFDVARMYVTDTSPFVVNTDALTLRVDTVSGAVSIVNASPTPFTIDSYRIESPTNRLNPALWNSLSDQNFGAIDGPDVGTTPGDGIGETWDEAGGSDAGVLAESFLLSSSAFAAMSAPVSLGNAFVPGTQPPLTFQYRNSVSGALLTGNVEFVASTPLDADFNNNNFVEGSDFLIWQRNLGMAGTNATGDANGDGQVTSADLTIWKSQFGAPPPTVASTTATPEPSAAMLAAAALGCMIVGTRRSRE